MAVRAGCWVGTIPPRSIFIPLVWTTLLSVGACAPSVQPFATITEPLLVMAGELEGMRRYDDPLWREAYLQVDRAASLLERTHRSVDPRVWEARDRWGEAARGWLEGTGAIDDAIEASLGFEESARTATSGTTPIPAE